MNNVFAAVTRSVETASLVVGSLTGKVSAIRPNAEVQPLDHALPIPAQIIESYTPFRLQEQADPQQPSNSLTESSLLNPKTELSPEAVPEIYELKMQLSVTGDEYHNFYILNNPNNNRQNNPDRRAAQLQDLLTNPASTYSEVEKLTAEIVREAESKYKIGNLFKRRKNDITPEATRITYMNGTYAAKILRTYNHDKGTYLFFTNDLGQLGFTYLKKDKVDNLTFSAHNASGLEELSVSKTVNDLFKWGMLHGEFKFGVNNPINGFYVMPEQFQNSALANKSHYEAGNHLKAYYDAQKTVAGYIIGPDGKLNYWDCPTGTYLVNPQIYRDSQGEFYLLGGKYKGIDFPSYVDDNTSATYLQLLDVVWGLDKAPEIIQIAIPLNNAAIIDYEQFSSASSRIAITLPPPTDPIGSDLQPLISITSKRVAPDAKKHLAAYSLWHQRHSRLKHTV